MDIPNQQIKIPKKQFEEIAGKYMMIIGNPNFGETDQNNAIIKLSEFMNRYTFK